jgi:hypothetical protein
MGGCVIESPDGARVFDNTLKTRWERMYPDIIKALSREVRRIVAEYPEFVSEITIILTHESGRNRRAS